MSYPRYFTIETPDGGGEARQDAREDAWHVMLPTTDFRWYGGVREVKREVYQRTGYAQGDVTFGAVKEGGS